MAVDLTKLAFYSEENYLKRSDFVGSQDLTLGGAGAVTTHTVTHNLGYIPFFIVGANINSDTAIWSNNRVWEYTLSSNSATGNDPVQLQYWCTTTTLTIRIVNGLGTGTQAGTRTVCWAIYLDYSNA